ncbi:hypothetical protein SDC9_38737 [bioreactor metagenome]|uniref:Uncharacterized protein n=1 Tax=bioreactor metagenome TaxID=1076179 RepID=A0A644VMK1_9ZZZZ
MQLIEDEGGQQRDRPRIGPEHPAGKQHDDDQLQPAMAEEVERVEALCLDREALRGMQQRIGEEITRVLGKLMRRQPLRQRDECALMQQQEHEAGQSLGRGQKALGEQARLEGRVQRPADAGAHRLSPRPGRAARIAAQYPKGRRSRCPD